MNKKPEFTAQHGRKLDRVSRKKIEVDEVNFIKGYGHLTTNHFLKPRYDLENSIAIYEPVNTLVSFIVKLEEKK